MIRVIQNIFFGIIAFVAAMVVVSFFLPDKYTIEDSIHIDASVETVFEQVNNLNRWEHWSFFAQDSNWNPTFGNDATSMHWESEKLGTVTLKIEESILNKKVHVFFELENLNRSGNAHYFFTRKNDGTQLTYRLEQPVPLTIKDKFINIYNDVLEKREEEKKNNLQLNYNLKHLRGVSEKIFRENNAISKD